MPLAVAESPPDEVRPPDLGLLAPLLPEVHTIAACDGLICVCSSRSPAKTTPNEDSFAVIPCGGRAGVLAVADGLGGLRDGDVASQLAIETLRRIVGESFRPLAEEHMETDGCLSLDEGGEPAMPRFGNLLRAAVLDGIDEANRLIQESAAGSATTISVVEIQGREIRPYHVGDSTTLVIGQRGKIKLQTVCHSPVGFLVEAGMLDPIDAIHHEDRHLVSNVVGSAEMRIEVGAPLSLSSRDTVLLGSDGLFDNLHVPEIVEIVRKGPLEAAVQTLARLATDRMLQPRAGQPSKPDDLTILAYRPAYRRLQKAIGSQRVLQTLDLGGGERCER